MPNEELKKMAEVRRYNKYDVMRDTTELYWYRASDYEAIAQEVETLREAQDIAEQAIGLAIFRLKRSEPGMAVDILGHGREKLRAPKQHAGEDGETKP